MLRGMNRQLLHFIKKESLHILRDTRTLLVVIGIPVVLMLLFGFAISTDVNNINVAVCSPLRSVSVESAVSALRNNELFTFKGYVRPDEIDAVLRTGDADAVLVFADDYDRVIAGFAPGEKAVQVILDGANPNSAASGAAYLTAMLDGIIASGGQSGMVESHILYNPLMKSSYNFVPGILGLIFILVCAMMTSISIVREKELGTMEVLLVSPVRPIWIIVSKMCPYFILSCFNLISVLVIARFALDVPITGSIFGIVFISVLYIVLSLGFGLMVSTITDKQMVALLISGMLLMVPVLMFSGMLYPIENLPKIFLPLTYAIPATWYIEAMRKLMIEGVAFISILPELAIILAMTVVIFFVALQNFNDRLE